MNLYNYFWCFPSALTPRFCDEVIKYALSKEDVMARTGGSEDKKLSKDQIKDMKRRRNSDIVWLNDRWIYNEIHPYIHQANKNAGWNFQWDWNESSQFTSYEKDDHYNWHNDQVKHGEDENKNFKNKMSFNPLPSPLLLVSLC